LLLSRSHIEHNRLVLTGLVLSSFCQLVTDVYCAKIAEPIKLPFGVTIAVGLRNHLLDGRAHCHHLANMVEQLCTSAMHGSATRDGGAISTKLLWAILLQ